jgi:hypothetical protein
MNGSKCLSACQTNFSKMNYILFDFVSRFGLWLFSHLLISVISHKQITIDNIRRKLSISKNESMSSD